MAHTHIARSTRRRTVAALVRDASGRFIDRLEGSRDLCRTLFNRQYGNRAYRLIWED